MAVRAEWEERAVLVVREMEQEQEGPVVRLARAVRV
jgi:hypothetical protein